MNQERYNFSDNNFEIAITISKKEFELYYQLITQIKPLENIVKTYKMVQEQYSELQIVPHILEKLPILSEQGYDLAIRKTTAYIVFNRIFIDNCKNLIKQLPDLELRDLINSFDKTTCEDNLHVLRNYANHTTIPITGLTFSSSTRKEPKIIPLVRRQDLIGNFNKHDKTIIDNWPKDGLEIMSEIKKSNVIIKTLINSIIHEFIKKRIDIEIIKQIKKDQKIWREILIPKKSRGVFSISENNSKKYVYTDSLLLELVISNTENNELLSEKSGD